MKHLLRVLFVLALLYGGSSFAHADGIDYRMTVLDPPASSVASCNDAGTPPGSPGNTNCTLFTNGEISPVNLSQGACTGAGVGAGLTAGTYGCFVVDNESGTTITDLQLSFLLAPLNSQPAGCDADGEGDLSSALNVVSCGPDPNNPSDYLLHFGGGTGVAAGSVLIVFEQGADPSDFQGGSASINVVTPEPDSLLLFSTGVVMSGLFLARRKLGLAAKA